MEFNATHNLPTGFELTRMMVTDVGTYIFYGNIVIVEAKEGIVLSYKRNFSVLLDTLNIIGDKPWTYIANRINSHSIKPIEYKYVNNIPNLKAVGVVNYNYLGFANAILETKFCKKPYEIFSSLAEAAFWGKSYL